MHVTFLSHKSEVCDVWWGSYKSILLDWAWLRHLWYFAHVCVV